MTKKMAITDSIVYGDGITIKDGISADRHISIGDNSETDVILLESGDALLQEDGISEFLKEFQSNVLDD